MPTLNIEKKSLIKRLGKNYSDEEFSELFFDFGLELDEVVEDTEAKEIRYKIDIPANRYDLLCLEGLCKALLIFKNELSLPLYKRTINAESCFNVKVTANTDGIRPFIVAAVLRNVSLTDESYTSLIDFQDKLHLNICRRRTLVAIGTHDLKTIKWPVIYDADMPENIHFRALNQQISHSARNLTQIYSNHAQLKNYVALIKNEQRYPVVKDASGSVLSLPPVINSHHSRISKDTKDIFIECTATDLTKAIIVLDMVVCAFGEYCAQPFNVECCKVEKAGRVEYYPELKYRKKTVDCKFIQKYLGIDLPIYKTMELLKRMSLDASQTMEGTLGVLIPPSRHDILHACDIVEDIAIAYGYNNIPAFPPTLSIVAKQLPLNDLTEKMRHHVAYSGFSEALTFSLCSRDDISKKMRKESKDLRAICISNPKTLEFQVARTSLIPGILKTLASNKQVSLPVKLFEISDILEEASHSSVGVKNRRNLCAIYCNKSAGFEIIHGLLDKIMKVLEIPYSPSHGYCLKSHSDPSFFPSCCAAVLFQGNVIGIMGILHPDVGAHFELSLPCSCLEICVESFVTNGKRVEWGNASVRDNVSEEFLASTLREEMCQLQLQNGNTLISIPL